MQIHWKKFDPAQKIFISPNTPADFIVYIQQEFYTLKNSAGAGIRIQDAPIKSRYKERSVQKLYNI